MKLKRSGPNRHITFPQRNDKGTGPHRLESRERDRLSPRTQQCPFPTGFHIATVSFESRNAFCEVSALGMLLSPIFISHVWFFDADYVPNTWQNIKWRNEEEFAVSGKGGIIGQAEGLHDRTGLNPMA